MTETNTGRGQAGEFDEALAALRNIDAELSTFQAEGLSKDQLCEQYKKIRPWIPTALPLIERIPIWGPKIATAVRLFMSIADQFCGVGG